jgi:N-acetylneuraminic acid mutarotase
MRPHVLWHAALALCGFALAAGPDLFARSRVDAYNVVTKTWTQVKSMPGSRVEPHGATPINGKLYVAGGMTMGDPATEPQRQRRTLYVYDAATNTWSRKADVPALGCGRGAQGAIGGQLYVYVPCVGGATVSDRFYQYDPATDHWRTLVPPPNRHVFGAAGVIQGKLYLVSGNGSGGLSRSLDVYDPTTQAWS